MTAFSAKFKLIYIPFLIIAAGTLCTYTFLNWLLIIKLQAFQISEEAVNILIPAGFIFIPLLIWLRPRLTRHLILVVKGKGDPLFGMIILAWLCIGAPMLIAQRYVTTATGKLTQLDNIARINVLPATKYYTVKDFYINKSLAHVHSTYAISGKHNTDFDMYIYVAVPVFDHLFPDTNKISAIRNRVNPKALIIINSKLSTMQRLKKIPADSINRMRYLNPSIVMPQYGDTGKYGAIAVITIGYKTKVKLQPSKMSPAAWLAVKYSKTIENSLPLDEKNKQFKAFEMLCHYNFTRTPLEKFSYLDRLAYNNKDLNQYQAAIKLWHDVEDDSNPPILWPRYNSFASRNGNKLAWLSVAFVAGAVMFLLALLLPRVRGKYD